MKKLIGLGVLLATGITAFAAPAYERFDGCNTRKEAVVVRHDNRAPIHRDVRVNYDRARR